MFINRKQAAYELVELLEKEETEFDLVIGVPRGGVVLACIIAKHFNCPVDVVMVKKLGSPGLPDYVAGVVSPDGEVMMHPGLSDKVDINMEELKNLVEAVKADTNRRLKIYRNYRKPIKIEKRNVLLVDDGIITGSTIKAAIGYIKRQKAKSIEIATPVCSLNTYRNLNNEVNSVYTLHVAENCYAVSHYYKDYTEVEDDEIIEMMQLYMAD